MVVEFYDTAAGGVRLGHVNELIRLLDEEPVTGPEGVPDAPAKHATDNKEYGLQVTSDPATDNAWIELRSGSREVVLQAPGRLVSGYGVSSMQLPVDYTTYLRGEPFTVDTAPKHTQHLSLIHI